MNLRIRPITFAVAICLSFCHIGAIKFWFSLLFPEVSNGYKWLWLVREMVHRHLSSTSSAWVRLPLEANFRDG